MDNINELVKALAKAQAEFPKIEKNAVNPHFKTRYADLGELISKTRDVLARHGLVIMQCVVGQDPKSITLRTTLFHESGQSISSDFPFVPEISPQKVGSQLTYFRRYSLASILNLAADDDDDAEVAQSTYEDRPDLATEAQKKAICGMVRDLGHNGDFLKELCLKHGCSDINQMTKANASLAIKFLQQLKEQKEVVNA